MALPKPSGSKGKTGKLPAPTGGGDFDPTLKAELVGKLGATGKIKILGAPEETPDSEFYDMSLPVEFKGKRYAMGLKISGGNYARLYKRFGTNLKKWRGVANVEVKHFKANDYVAIV
jgi:hypothetical protein